MMKKVLVIKSRGGGMSEVMSSLEIINDYDINLVVVDFYDSHQESIVENKHFKLLTNEHYLNTNYELKITPSTKLHNLPNKHKSKRPYHN